MKKLSVVLVFFVAALLLNFTAAPSAAQGSGTATAVRVKPEATPARPDVRPQWGAQGLSIKEVHALTCMPARSDTAYSQTAMGQRYCTGGICVFECNVDVPSGAQIIALGIEGCDTSRTAAITADMFRDDYGGGLETWIVEASSGYAAIPGCDIFYADLPTPETVDNLDYSYYVEVSLGNKDTTTTFNAIRIYYQLQISPAPGTATFNDVPTSHPFFQYIEALYASGITTGCPLPNFCPDMAVTRGQMAAFLARGLGLYWSY